MATMASVDALLQWSPWHRGGVASRSSPARLRCLGLEVPSGGGGVVTGCGCGCANMESCCGARRTPAGATGAAAVASGQEETLLPHGQGTKGEEENQTEGLNIA